MSPTQIGGGTSTESDLIGSVWGFNYHYGWIQSLIIFAFIVVFMTVALFASRKIRHLS